ncbi:MAG: rhomboid family intramembrane serine protease [Rhodospirillaceae bacterium]
MFFPYGDDNPHVTTPYVNYALIAACGLVFLWEVSTGAKGQESITYIYGLIPARLFGSGLPDPSLSAIAPWLTIFTSMFLHGGWMHLLGNMLYLWIFGDNIEHSLGHFRYLVFYLLCGIAAALAQSISAPGSEVPMVGASGAISGILGAYLVLHPKANIKVFVFLIFITTVNLPAFVVLGGWFLMQLLNSAQANAGGAGVAFLAHIGGFVAGAVMVFFFRRREVAVFQPAHSKPFAVERRPYRRGSVPDAGGNIRRGPWG